MIELIFLGTSGGMPTKERAHSAIALRYGGEVLLFECGENAQRQFMYTTYSPMKIDKIFISHWHADHFAGLPGLIQSMSLQNRSRDLHIYGPKSTKKFIDMIMKTGHFKCKFDVIPHEVTTGKMICAGKKYSVYTIPTNHSVETLAYKFEEMPRPGKFNASKAKKLGIQEKDFGKLQDGKSIKVGKKKIKPDQVIGPDRPGKTIVYSGDTIFNPKIIEFSEKADLLIHEATFGDEMREWAEKVGHTTNIQAAEIAKKAKVKELILTHLSPRYKETKTFLAQAKTKFKNTKIANDFMEIVVK
jgi:ribonuclease Z